MDNLELDSSPLWWINLIALLYCTAAIPILSIVYGINYGKYNQTILLLCIIGLTVFLISQIIFLLFRKRYKEYKPANVAIKIQTNPASDKTHTSEPWCDEAQFASNNKAIPIIKKRAKITRLIIRSFSVFSIVEHTESSFLSLIASLAQA